MARAIRAHCLASGQSAEDIALMIHSQCGPAFGTTLVRAQRLALGIALADVVAQVRARYVNEGGPRRGSRDPAVVLRRRPEAARPRVPPLPVLRVPGRAGRPRL